MPTSVLQRLEHIAKALDNIDTLLGGKTAAVLQDPFALAAYERFLEIISEASRHVPNDLKLSCGPSVRWRNVADIGNVLRHAYQHSDAGILWNIYVNDLPSLKDAVNLMIFDITSSNQTPGPTKT